MLFTAFSKEAADTFVAIYGVVSHPPKLPDGRTERGFGIFFFCHFLPRMIMQPPEAGGTHTLSSICSKHASSTQKKKRGEKLEAAAFGGHLLGLYFFLFPGFTSPSLASSSPRRLLPILFFFFFSKRSSLKFAACCQYPRSLPRASYSEIVLYTRCVCVWLLDIRWERDIYPILRFWNEKRRDKLNQSVRRSFVPFSRSLPPSSFHSWSSLAIAARTSNIFFSFLACSTNLSLSLLFQFSLLLFLSLSLLKQHVKRGREYIPHALTDLPKADKNK